MDILTVLLIAFGLAMDACAVSIASGAMIKRNKIRNAVTYGMMFGGFQMLMPVVGYGAGSAFRRSIASLDHWVAFGLLFVIGVRMIIEASRIEAIERSPADLSAVNLLGLALATSIDALAVGISFSCIKVDILLPVLMIGAVTFVMSFAGVLIGNRFGGLFEKRIGILGGAILIGIGVKILLEHLL